jgi:hypothetical protein
MRRREFVKATGAALACGPAAMAQSRAVSVVMAASESAPARWAAGELAEALTASGYTVERRESLAQTAAGAFCIVGRSAAGLPEGLSLAPLRDGGRTGVLATGEGRGLVYALLELADRARHGASLDVPQTIAERPANPVRSIARLFVSDVEDKPWFNDRDMWPHYLTMLATQRFNRFNLSVGIGYDFLREVTDAYLLFAYPFLLSVPGYNVRARNLPDAERDRNLEMLQFISQQTVARGLEFQLGIWMHGYEWINSPKPNYVIEGLTAENHAAYCRDALAALLKACPAISGVTLRIHGESGVPEGNYDFWKTVFDGARLSGRKVELDLHSKGSDPEIIDVALATGLPVKVSPKFWAEHMGMPYHQADIREQEMPRVARNANALMALSTGARSFTRYGYADLLREDRRYGVLHRIWPGTQRLLLWGDPVFAAAYSRAFTFCGSSGVEVMEPLSFKGRRGSGLPGGRNGYADASLKPKWDWEKYTYTYRVWGRLLYNPQADPETWRRELRDPAAETALASASRILPIVTTAHLPSAANNTYWPEIYTNQPIVEAGRNPYGDTPAPKVFGNASPLDPQLFSRMNDFADELLKGERSGKYSPIEVAQWLEDLADTVAKNLPHVKPNRRLTIDLEIQAGLGRFYAAKFRAGVLYRIHEKTGDRAALERALEQYRRARAAWAQIVERTKGVYVADVSVGELPWLRGHWSDRLPAIDEDIAVMAKRLDKATDGHAETAIEQALGRPKRVQAACQHTPPATFRPKQSLPIEIASDVKLISARLHYRRVTQAERFQSSGMQVAGDQWRATIPAAYTDSAYPLQYYFEFKSGPETAWLYPGLGPDLTSQPYFVVRRV